MTERTAVYRFYDHAGHLLYIGMTDDPDGRFSAHAASKPWWADVARTTIDWHPSRSEAATAEADAIRTEHSLHNVAGSPWAPKPRQLGEHEMTIGQAAASLLEIVDSGQVTFIVDRTRARQPIAAIVPLELLDQLESTADGLTAMLVPDAKAESA